MRVDGGSEYSRSATGQKFEYEGAMASVEKLRAWKDVDIVCVPHWGGLTDYIPAFERAKKQMELWLEILSQLPPEAGREEAVAELLRRDPVMDKLGKLPKNVKNRELFFIGQSANGYHGRNRRDAPAR